MIYSGEPIREPVAMGGPYAKNRRVEIVRAFNDLHAGKFGNVPRRAGLAYDLTGSRRGQPCWSGQRPSC